MNKALIGCMVVIPTIFAAFGMPTESGVVIGAIFLALIFANLPRIVRFKGVGFEAEIREVQAVVDKAYAAIHDLKNVALALTDPIMTSLTMSGRVFQYVHLKHKLQHMAEIQKTLKQLGASDAEIANSCLLMITTVTKGHVHYILKALEGANTGKDVFGGQDEWDLGNWDMAKVNAFIVEHKLNKNADVEECLLDFDQFLTKGTLRREDRWQH